TIGVSSGSFVKLQILAPGEIPAPGTASGKTGTPTAQTAGTAFSMTVNAVDANWNVVTNVSHTVALTCSDANASLPGNTPLVARPKSLSVTPKTSGTATAAASDVTDGTKTPQTSSSINVNPGAFAKLQVLAPGENAAPGTGTGKSGAPLGQTAGSSFSIIVNAV